MVLPASRCDFLSGGTSMHPILLGYLATTPSVRTSQTAIYLIHGVPIVDLSFLRGDGTQVSGLWHICGCGKSRNFLVPDYTTGCSNDFNGKL